MGSLARRAQLLWLLALPAMVACGGSASPPHYGDAAAIAKALNGHGIPCTYSPLTPADALGAASGGQCRGSDFVALIYVFASTPEREAFEKAARAYSCDHGVTRGSYVSANRWLVTLDAQPTGDPTAVYMRDIASATGGKRTPQRCR